MDDLEQEQGEDHGSASEETTQEQEEDTDRGDEIEQLRSELRSELNSVRAEIARIETGFRELQSELSSREQRNEQPARRDEGPRPKKFWWQPLIQEI